MRGPSSCLCYFGKRASTYQEAMTRSGLTRPEMRAHSSADPPSAPPPPLQPLSRIHIQKFVGINQSTHSMDDPPFLASPCLEQLAASLRFRLRATVQRSNVGELLIWTTVPNSSSSLSLFVSEINQFFWSLTWSLLTSSSSA